MGPSCLDSSVNLTNRTGIVAVLAGGKNFIATVYLETARPPVVPTRPHRTQALMFTVTKTLAARLVEKYDKISLRIVLLLYVLIYTNQTIVVKEQS